MNRIYNVIWSKTKKCYVVVSEIVKTGGGKVKSVQTGTTWARMSAIMAVAALLMGGNITTVNAATYAAMTIDAVNDAGYATGKKSYSEGSYLYNYQNPGNLTPFDNSHLYNGTDRGNYTENSFAGIAIGTHTNIVESGNSNYHSGLAIGNYAQATGGISFALGHYAQALSPSAMALGTATKASGFNSLAMMRQSAAEGEFSTALGTASWAKGNGSFAMGYSATAKADQSIAIGAAETIKLPGQQHGTPSAKYNGDGNTVTEGARSLAFGTKARTAVGADDSMAFGSSSSTGGANAVAMGYSANASAENAFAIGNTAQSSAQNAVAMGKSANASGVSSFAMGSSSNAAGADAIAMGSSSQAKLSNSIALGGNAKSLGADALALGGAANASKDGAIAIGKEAKANNTNTTAIGLGATVTGTNSMAIGTNAVAESNNSLALGTGTEVRGALVNGFSAFTNQQNNNVANGVVAVGNVGSERRIINVAGGENDTDATNVKQLKFVNSNLAKSIAGPTYTGYEANGSTYKAPDFNIKNSTYHTVKEAVEAAQTNFFSAKGTSADANYNNAGATGNNATAAGVRTSAAGNFATAVGADATAANANSTAIGYKAKSSVDDGVALGANSAASVAAGKAGYNVKTADSRTNGYSGLTGATLTSTMGAVSVGDGGTKTRQITNVAAGTADTDAVNVAQLRNVNLKVAGNSGNNDVLLDNQTLTVKGDGSYVTTSVNNQTIDVTLTDATKKKIDNAANQDLSNITNAGKKNITALGTIVQAGNNVTVGAPAVDATTGQKTYTVNGMDTKASLGTSGLMTLSGGQPDASGVRNYTVDVDPTKVAKTDLSNITDGGKSVIRDEAQKAVKVVAGKNTTITEGTDGTYKTYKVDVDAPDYQLTENSSAADKAYTVSGNKVDLTVQDAKNPANKKTVTIKDIASKTELDDTKTELINKGLKFDADNGGEKTNKLGSKVAVKGDNSNIITEISQDGNGDSTIDVKLGKDLKVETITATGANGKDGKIGINGKDGVTTNISVSRDGQPGVDGAAGTTTTRIVYQKPDGSNEEVATLNDGLKFKGDMGATSNVKLNKQVDINGGVTSASDLATGNNIGVTSAAVGADGNAKLQLQLAKNLTGLQSVTASDTVKAGTATVGNHTVADNKGANQTGNFVTGLDNTSWNIADPVYVPNRAATEEQLKTVSDALKAANASSTDYRLIANPDNAQDGSYKVTNNQIDLKVKDEKSKDVKTVTIKDVASKTELDKVKDRSVKYDGDTDKDTVTLEGPNGTKITNLKDGNVAAGSKDAVNGGQLHDAKNELINTGLKFDANVGGVKTNKLGSTVTIQGEGTAADADYSGENLKTFIKQDAATGNTTIDVKMNKNLKAESVKVGKDGKDGVSITGPDTANGTDGKVAVTDKNGKEAVSISGKDGVGHIGLTGPAGTNGVNGTNGIDLSVKPGYNDSATGVKGEKGVDGTNGLTRIVYTDGNGEHQVATMEDGLQFTGNNTGTVNKQKLNSLVKVQGEGVTEAESTTFKSASGNINVKADGTDKLELQLAKDLKNLDSVTAAKTVKAGGATMGGQTVNNVAGDSETGNYVTGLDNKDWDADKIVSGRAATEDQLKKALDAQSANSTDYRLIKNQAAGSNGDYTVDANGDVALTVQDKNHPDQTETVTIKDVASKSKLDKLNDRAVKYDLDPTGNPDKSKVTYEGPTYNNKQGGTHVTNVAYATGNDGSEAVNVDYLNDKIKDSADALTNKGLKFDANQGGEKTNKLGSKVTIKGEGTAADDDYSGENLKTFITQDQTSGDTTINVKMNKNLKAESVKVGKDGKDGVSITGPDAANGTDGKVAVTGKDGKEAVSISGKDGVGHIGLNGKDGRSADISVEKGDPDLNGKEITRIKYTDEDGNTHQVATKDDGMAYGGDSGNVIKKKLNEQLDIKGGVTNEDDLTENNIGVISKNNILNVRLAKDLKDLNSITFNNGANGANGKTVVNGEGMTIKDAAGNSLTAVTKDGVKITNGPSMTKDGIDAAGKKVTNVADGTVAKDSKDAVNGGQLHDAVESLKTKGFGLEAEDGQSVKKPLGETVKVKGDDTNIKTSVDGGAVKVELKKDITVDTVTANTVTTGDTKMDTNGVTIKDGANEATKLTKDGLQINDGGNKAVTINKDGLTIENGPKVTKDGIDAADKKITNVADGTIGAGSKDAVNGGQLHTAIEDIKSTGFGLKAEDGQSVKKPLGETIDLKGDGNIKTSVDNGAIKMALNDKITLGQDPAKQVKIDGTEGTVTAGNGDKEVKLDGAAGTITAGKGDNQVKIDGNDGSVTANTVKAGDVVVGKQTSDGKEGNFVTGLDNKTWDPENPVAVPGRAATEDQLKAVNDDFNNKARTGRVFQGDQSGDSGKVVRGLGDTMNLTGGADVNRLADNNIGVVKNAAGDGYNIKLAKDLKGLESVTTMDAAGNTTVMNGGGMTITPAQGNAVSLTKDGLNNGGNRITNVGPGVDGTDAVNVNQLSSAMRSVDGKIADVGATSAAISGLKPLQYDPLEPTQVLAAVGHYKGSTAAAVGVAHYTNESTMFHMGVSLGGHDNMINAGVSYKFGTSDAKKAVPARYKGGPISSTYVLQDEVTALKAENERMKQHDLELTAKYDQVQRDNEEMKAQIALLMQQVGLSK